MTKEQLITRRQQLIAALATIGQAPLDTPAGARREEVVADLRNTNAAIKQLNIDEARRAKSEADRKKSRGVAEHVANLQRAGAPADALPAAPPEPPAITPADSPSKRAGQTPGEFVLWSAKQLRKLLRRFKHPLPHTTEFLTFLEKFIAQQADHVREEEARAAASAPSDWQETWRGAAP